MSIHTRMGEVDSRADLLVAVAEDVAQLRIGFEQLLVEEGGDGYAVLREDGDGRGDELALLRGERRGVRQVVAGLDGFGHDCVGMVSIGACLRVRVDILYYSTHRGKSKSVAEELPSAHLGWRHSLRQSPLSPPLNTLCSAPP